MLQYQARMILELRTLNDDIMKLRRFINSPGLFDDLVEDEKQDCRDQLKAMEDYAKALTSRCRRANLI